ncbi:MAG: hypothetical protein K8M05_30435 [Deltaproteobacteria bacterium]|nr:hypothetical protein [Kofleriaceae bacterium]
MVADDGARVGGDADDRERRGGDDAAGAAGADGAAAGEKREIERLLLQVDHASAESERWRRENIIEVRVPCHAAVYRGDLDGRPQPFEECIEYRRK